jgi:putative transcriptional regulator
MKVMIMNPTPIAKVILETGLKKGFIAKKANIAPATLTAIVSGKSEPTLRVALRLSRILEKSVEELWGHLEEGEK